MKIVFVTSSVTLLREITSPLWRANVFLACRKLRWEIAVYNTIFRTQASSYFLHLHTLVFYTVYYPFHFSYIFISVLFRYFPLFSVLALFLTSFSSHVFFISLFFFLSFFICFKLPAILRFFLSFLLFSVFLHFFPSFLLPSVFLLFFRSCFCFLFLLDMVFSLTILLCFSFPAFYISTLCISIHNCDILPSREVKSDLSVSLW